MVPRKQYVRANSFMSLLDNAPGILGPVFAVFLVNFIGLSGILALNLLSFVVSISALLLVEVPPTPHTVEGEMSRSKFWKDVFFGIKYLIERPGLLGVQLIFLFGNFFSGIAMSLTALYTMIFLRTGGDPNAAGTVQSIGALAAVVVGLLLTGYGRIKRPIRAILFGWILSSLFGVTLFGLGQFMWIWLIAVVIDSSFEPVVNVSIETFLQTKIPPDLQGRVFAASDFLAQAMIPLAPLLAGFFGEKIFEPAMRDGGLLASTFGRLVGTGPGAGFGLMILLCGIGGTLIGVFGYFTPAIRNVNRIIPDYELYPQVVKTDRQIKPEVE
jgi:hypothetical protein